MRTTLLSILFFLFFCLSASSQGSDTTEFVIGIIEGNDTIIQKQVKEIIVFPDRNYKGKRYVRRFWRYVHKVKKVYPYAIKINELLEQHEPEYLALETQREKRRLIRSVEKELMAEYKNELKRLTISEGRILIKLIDRETSRTSYTLIKDFRGGFAAFFWQSIARLFGNDLKAEYDPVGEDRMVEEVVKLIEQGVIKVSF